MDTPAALYLKLGDRLSVEDGKERPFTLCTQDFLQYTQSRGTYMIQANQKNDLAVDLEKAFKKAKTNTLISKVSMELKKEFSMSFVDSDARKHNETWSRLAS